MVVSDYPVEYAPSKSVSFSLKNPLKIRNSIEKLRQIIQEFNPSIIHVHQANSYAFIAGKANNNSIPMVLTAWGSDILLLPKRSIIHRWLVKQALTKADIVTADSVQMIEEIQGLCPGKEVINANFGVDLDIPEVMNADRELILYSNRMHEPLYRIEDILNEFNAMCKDSDGQLILAGKGSLTEKLKRFTMLHELTNQVTFTGFVTKTQNMSNYLKSKFFISIPTSDGTSISLLEALAYGCIPLLSDIPAMGVDNDDAARRFVNMVDEFYDRGVKLIVSAHMSIDRIYTGVRLEFEFERTKSRLLEMQSDQYLAKAHAPD